MLSIRKLTEYTKKQTRPGTVSVKKLTSLSKLVSKGYQPLTRFEKLRQTGLVFPKSTPSKIVFISNSHGNGFRNQNDADFPMSIPVQKMKEQVDLVCYQKWKEYKDFLENDAFRTADFATKILITIGLIVIALLFFTTIGNTEIESMYDTLLLASGAIMVICLISALVIFAKRPPEYDFDSTIISSIKSKLFFMNLMEKEVTSNQPRFQWTCNKDCTWIAIELFQQTIE